MAFPCADCEKSFDRVGDLARHQQNVHGGVVKEQKTFVSTATERTSDGIITCGITRAMRPGGCILVRSVSAALNGWNI